MQKVKVEDIKPDSSLSEKLPLSGKLVVFIPKNESKEQMMVHSGYGHQWLLNPGENLKKQVKMSLQNILQRLIIFRSTNLLIIY
ncbi:MAG: hypothetical protein RNU03_18655 [Candidatus Sedimenticola sp. (ex Thyasira tokunagai)]